jgi:hypothetical protein
MRQQVREQVALQAVLLLVQQVALLALQVAFQRLAQPVELQEQGQDAP